VFVSRIIRVRRQDRVIRGCTDGVLSPHAKSCFRRKKLLRHVRIAKRPLPSPASGIRKTEELTERELTVTPDTSQKTQKARYKKTRVSPTPTPTPHSSHTHIEIISGVPQKSKDKREKHLITEIALLLFQNTQNGRPDNA